MKKKIFISGVSFIVLLSSVVFSQVTISGTVKTEAVIGLEGVTITFSNSGGTTSTDASGVYSQALASGWSGTGRGWSVSVLRPTTHRMTRRRTWRCRDNRY